MYAYKNILEPFYDSTETLFSNNINFIFHSVRKKKMKKWLTIFPFLSVFYFSVNKLYWQLSTAISTSDCYSKIRGMNK